MVGVAAVAATFAGVVVAAGGLGVAASRAQGAADASALAAAAEARDLRALGGAWGADARTAGGDPCAVARDVADAWGVVMVKCVVAGDASVEVAAEVRVGGVTITRRSRAGTG